MSRLLFALALFIAPAALAQPVPQSGAPGAEAQPAPAPETREEMLDRLFASLAEAEGDEADAIADRIAAIWAHSGSDSMDLLLQRARKATKEREFDRARAHLAALTRLAPDFAEGWNASATLHFMQDEYWLAVEEIERALALEPRHFGALSGLAMILEHVGQDEAALEAWREVARIFPGMERAQEAIARLEKAVEGKKI